MINKYEATCCICSKAVLAGTGQTNMVKGHWRTEHNNEADCDAAEDRKPRHRPRAPSRDYGAPYPYEDDYGLYGYCTSEDVNPNEGSK